MQEQMGRKRKRIYRCGKQAWTARVRYTSLCLPDCNLECLEDIVRFLRHDTPVLKPVRYVPLMRPFCIFVSGADSPALSPHALPRSTQLAQWEVVQQHILPLFSWEADKQEILFQAAKVSPTRFHDLILTTTVLQVLVMLTMPDVAEAETRAQLIEAHQAYKEAFLKQVPVSSISPSF